MAAVRWPSPASWAIRSARCAPWCTSPSPPRRRRPGRGGAAGPAGRAVPGRDPRLDCPGVRLAVTEVLIQAGDFAAAERVCAAALAASRDAGDLWNLPDLLYRMALLDLRAGRTGDAAAHLREALRLALRAGSWPVATWTTAGTCAPRPGATPRPSRRGPRTPRSSRTWTARGTRGTGRNRCAPPGRRWDPSRRGQPRSAARR